VWDVRVGPCTTRSRRGRQRGFQSGGPGNVLILGPVKAIRNGRLDASAEDETCPHLVPRGRTRTQSRTGVELPRRGISLPRASRLGMPCGQSADGPPKSGISGIASIRRPTLCSGRPEGAADTGSRDCIKRSGTGSVVSHHRVGPQFLRGIFMPAVTSPAPAPARGPRSRRPPPRSPPPRRCQARRRARNPRPRARPARTASSDAGDGSRRSAAGPPAPGCA
jgi:hypothetical protein